MTGLVLAALAETGLVTWRTVRYGRPGIAGGGRIPWPADFAAVAVIYGALGLVGQFGPDWETVAATAGWGIVAATTLNLFDPSSLQRAQTTIGKQPSPIVPTQPGAQT